MKVACRNLIWNSKALFGFLFFITYHSISVTHHSSLITHHLKIHTLFGTITHFHHSIFSTLFMGPTSAKGSEQTVLLPAEGFPPHLFLFSHFAFFPSSLSLSQSTNLNPEKFPLAFWRSSKSLKALIMSSTTATISIGFWVLKASCISFKDSASRCFGYMVSKKKYILLGLLSPSPQS